jgi:hypothetical protein
MLYAVMFGLVVVCGLAGAYVADQKGRPRGEGLVLGALLGPLGVVVAALMPGPQPKTEAPSPVAYQFKPRRMLGEIDESRGLRKID